MSPKPLHFLMLFGIFWLSCTYHRPAGSPAQGAKIDRASAFLFDKLDTIGIFRRLFDNPLMKGDTAIRKPNFYESQSVQLSYDDSAHTVIDTVLYFTDQNKRQCAAYVFGR